MPIILVVPGTVILGRIRHLGWGTTECCLCGISRLGKARRAGLHFSARFEDRRFSLSISLSFFLSFFIRSPVLLNSKSDDLLLLWKQEKKSVASGGRFLLSAGNPFLATETRSQGGRKKRKEIKKREKNATEKSVNGEIYNKITAELDRSVLLNTAL